ncbi:DNA-binding transcriptional regulator AraC [Neobacillus kokaensis]|uniref:DNA-binding transcriptional regulator AraC n=2 Tax=Neobacillus kokaensis TaxID=2759023 RepID=A0ABQ3NB25_9BACI|nr:DNA-binding transcriptional regulator AraC [Neobacillus kokaensis]
MKDTHSPYPRLGVSVAGHFHMNDSYVTKRPQGMSDWLITFTLGGEGYFLINKEEKRCSAGDIVLLRAGTPHQYGTCQGKEWNFLWAHFTQDLFEINYLPDGALLTHTVENDFVRKRTQQAFEKLIQDYREKNRYWNELCQNSLSEILLLYAQRQHQSLDPRMEEVLHLLSKNMKDSIRIDDVAKSVGLSSSRLSHLFKENMGQSILETLNQMRLNQAILLLEHTDRTATEVAIDVGFQNYNHFANQFRRRYGMPPREYRRKTLGPDPQ